MILLKYLWLRYLIFDFEIELYININNLFILYFWNIIIYNIFEKEKIKLYI